MEFDKVSEAVDRAISQLLENDLILLQNDVHERSITHWLAAYLANEFKDWDVDCEYNRNANDTKELLLCRHRGQPNCIDLELDGICEIPFELLDTSRVYPDIIVHQRNTPRNLLVVEVKKSTSREPHEFDLHKLRAYISQLHYHYGLFIEIETGNRHWLPNAKCCWIAPTINGSMECL